MDYGVKDSGVAINKLSYEKNRRSHAKKFVGRKNMLNSLFEDGRNFTLIIDKDSTVTTYDSVQFLIDDFEDGNQAEVNTYHITLEVIPIQ